MIARTTLRTAAAVALAATVATASALVAAGTAAALPSSSTVVTLTFGAAGPGSVALPAAATEITVDLAAAAGESSQSFAGGTGGAVSLALPDSFAGTTLSFVVGAQGGGSPVRSDGRPTTRGGGGTALASGSTLIAVVGGGGGAANVQIPDAAISTAVSGGAGGSSVTPGLIGAGSPGDPGFVGSHAPGGGATSVGGQADPAATDAGTPIYGGANGSGVPASVSGGVLTLAGGGVGGYTGGGGGSGFTGGAGGTLDISTGSPFIFDFGSGGGGSGYLSALTGVTATAATPSTGAGSVIVRYLVPKVTAGALDTSTAFGTPLSVALPVTNATSAAIAIQPSFGTASISGLTLTYTPAAGFNGTDSFTYTATGPGGTTAPAVVTVAVGEPSLTFPTGLASGVAAQPYTASVAVTGGTAPYTYSVVGALPAGLSLNASTGAITGTPTAAGDTTFRVTVTDSSTPEASATSAALTIHVYSATIVVTPAVSQGGSIALTGSGLQPGTYSVVLHSDPIVLGSATVGASGALSFRAAVPSSVPVGGHTVLLLSGTTVIASAAVTVTAATVASTTVASTNGSADPTTLAATGSDARTPLGISLLLLVSGIALAAIRRRWAARPAHASPDTMER